MGLSLRAQQWAITSVSGATLEPIELPTFAPLLLIVAVVALVVCAVVFVRGSGRGETTSLEAALTPFAMPVGVTAFTVLVITLIGLLLLVTVNTLLEAGFDAEPAKLGAVAVAMLLSVVILVIAAYLASRSGGTSHEAP